MIDSEKLFGLLPNYIPDYCLQPSTDESASNHWHSLIIQAYQKVFDSTVCFLYIRWFVYNSNNFISNVLEYFEYSFFYFRVIM